MKNYFVIIHLSENKDQNSGTSFLLAELTESKNMPLVMQALSQGKKPEGDTFVFKYGSDMAKHVSFCANNNELLELDLSDFRTQQKPGLDGNKLIHIYLK